MPKAPVNTHEFSSLVEVVSILRGPEGCPWDKEQTHKTLTRYAIEEAHELAEAIDQGDQNDLVEELGDLLLQVLIHAEIGRQEKRFTLEDVIRGITEKMIRRHPHVFGDVKVRDSEEVLSNWSKLKEKEKSQKAEKNAKNDALGEVTAQEEMGEKTAGETQSHQSPFANIPKNLPALIRAQKIGDKTVRFNFDWPGPWPVVEKIEEELNELKEALHTLSLEEQEKELGDLLFSVAQLARHLHLDAEQALRLTNKKFERRFLKMRELVENDQKIFSNLPVSELELYWQKAKTLLAE